MNRLFGSLALATSAVLGVAAMAHAETLTIHDGRDTDAVQELVAVRIVHERTVKVVMKFSSNYHRQGEYPFSIYYDTDPRDRGPEYVFVSHFGGVYTTERFGGASNQVDCNLRGHVNDERHTITIAISHRCLEGDRGPVGVNVSAVGKAADASFVPDYAPGFHEFSARVARG